MANNCLCFYFLISEKHKLNRDLLHVKSSLTEFNAMFHTWGLTWHESQTWYVVSLCWWFDNLPPWFHLCNLWRDNLQLQSSTKATPSNTHTHTHTNTYIYIYIYIYIKHTLSPCSTVTKHCFEHVMCSWCSFPESGTKRDTTASFLTSAIG